MGGKYLKATGGTVVKVAVEGVRGQTVCGYSLFLFHMFKLVSFVLFELAVNLCLLMNSNMWCV